MKNQSITGKETPTETSSPYSALIKFYSAFNNRDFDLMESNWLQTDEASMSNPLGDIKHGWNDIREIYKKIFSGKASVSVEFYDYSIHATEHMFVAVGRERGILELNGNKTELSIRTSRIYKFNNGQWKQIHHHGSMDNPQLLHTYQSILLNK